jgi:hypothetical protein
MRLAAHFDDLVDTFRGYPELGGYLIWVYTAGVEVSDDPVAFIQCTVATNSPFGSVLVQSVEDIGGCQRRRPAEAT